ncbi:MAG TPA: alpha/beta hydrolase [Acidimicrobiia bacterium]|nr:alpha/beta hydrolase [Acidimicrobiia bacterium]
MALSDAAPDDRGSGDPDPAGAPTVRFVHHDGLRIAALDWGGAPGARPLVLLHPNGFCAGFFDPLARRLAARGRFRPVAVDLRGHGATDKPPPPGPYHYEGMAGDVLAVLDDFGFEEVDIAGNSLGGGVAVHVDRLAPGRARRLLLGEPVVLRIEPGQTVSTAHPMAAAALRRKVVWPSREAMIRSYGSRPPMDRLAPEALAAYVEWGTEDRPDGRVQLACPPEVEAAIFVGSPALAGVNAGFDHLRHLRASAVLLTGACSTIPPERMEAAAAQAGSPLVVLEDTGHFMLSEDTARAVALIEEHLG